MSNSSQANAPAVRRVLNVKALVVVVVVCIVVKVATSAIHTKQIVKTRDYLKQTAQEAMADEDSNRAFDLYEQYLVLVPEDLEAQEIIASLLQDHGTKARELQRAFDINEKILLHNRERDDLRVKQVQLSEKLGRYSEASGHLDVLRQKNSDLSAVWYYSGVIAEDTGASQDAIEFYQKASLLPAPSADTFERLANLLSRESGDPAAAEALLTNFVANSEGNPDKAAKAHAIRARWFLDQQRPHYAIAEMWKSLDIKPQNARNNATLLRAIQNASESDNQFDSQSAYRRLIQHFESLLQSDPNQARIRLFLSAAYWQTDQRPLAIETLQDGIERDSRDYELYEVLVDYLVSDHQHELAQAYFDRIPQRVLNRGRREFMRGRLLMSHKEWPEATKAFEMAVSLSHQDKDMGTRARICLALCKRESGQTDAAMDTYRNLVKDDPNSEGGRLGMASAYLRNNQLALAIAEYRQLMHVDGVPPFLANLMIRYNLTLPVRSRRWDELESLLSDEDGSIRDDVQRQLLTVDMIFAKGYPSQAMAYLDDAARRSPDQPEFQRAFRSLNAVHGNGLQKRIQQALDDDPTNTEAHEGMLKLLAARDNGEAKLWLDDLMRGSSWPHLADENRYQIVATTASLVADGELATRGQTPQVRLLLNYALTAWKQLSDSSQMHLPGYVRFLAMYQSGEAAKKLLMSHSVKSKLREAECWLQIARHERSMTSTVAAELLKIIRSEPENYYLRLAFVDLQILSGKYKSASETLSGLVKFDASSGVTVARQAWLALLVSKNLQTASQLSRKASGLAASDPEVRAVRGLVLAESGEANQGLKVLNGISLHDRSVATELYVTRALQLSGKLSAARYSLRQLRTRRAIGGLAPADRELMKRIHSELIASESPKSTSRQVAL